MRCVKCNMELSEGSRFCEYCGAPQPEQPRVISPVQTRKMYCGVCGRELPFGSRFCTYCGAPQSEQRAEVASPTQGMGAVPPYAAPSGQYHSSPDASRKNNKKKAVMIGAIAGGIVLFMIILASVIFFIGRNIKDKWKEPEKTEESRQEEENDRDEVEENYELEETEEEPEEEVDEEDPAEEQDLTEEQNPETDGLYAEVDFDEISYEPEDQPYDILSDDELKVFNDQIMNRELVTDDSVEGTIRSVSSYRDLNTTVFYEPGTGEIRSIRTIEEQMYGAQIVGTTYLFQDKKLLVIRKDTFHGSSNPENTDYYFFQKDCMIAEQTVFSSVDGTWSLLRRDLGTASDYDKNNFIKHEADYFNRAYKLYDAVSRW